MAVTLQPEAQQGQGLERVRLQDGMRPAERVNVGWPNVLRGVHGRVLRWVQVHT